jgi:thiamine pyrophosphokinase
MTLYVEITHLGVRIDNALAQIDYALDCGNRRAFKLWCRRRADLITLREKALLAAATTEVPA